MNKQTIIIAALSICILPLTVTHAKPDYNASAPTISVTKLDINDKVLELRYEIRNYTNRDLWISEGVGKYDISAEVFIEKDNQTLLLRSRLDIPTEPGIETPSFDGRYVHLASGQSLSESISLPIPVQPYYGFRALSEEPGIINATRLALEIGYYVGDLPEIIHDRLVKEKMSEQKRSSAYTYAPNKLINYFAGKGVLIFNEMNEGLRSRDEEVLIPYTDQLLKGERSLRITVDNLCIPYAEKGYPSQRDKLTNLPSCMKVEIRYQPSMLKYFFPYEGQQSLLSPDEIHYLRTVRKIVLDNHEDIEAIINDIRNSVPTIYGVVRERTAAYVIFHDGGQCLTSIPIYNSASLVDSKMQVYTNNEGFLSLKIVTPWINKIQLRVDCAANLKNLWYRFQLYNEAEKYRTKDSSDNDEIIYPSPVNWCDAMILAYKSIGHLDRWVRKPLICPAMNKDDKCYYAMNPNCKYDSLPDMVLLFETKAGWNQHGGPELFTFDNHDPKGGCVLLNDGTVKFIRTPTELQQLRWK
jgi:hypothetical protein